MPIVGIFVTKKDLWKGGERGDLSGDGEQQCTDWRTDPWPHHQEAQGPPTPPPARFRSTFQYLSNSGHPGSNDYDGVSEFGDDGNIVFNNWCLKKKKISLWCWYEEAWLWKLQIIKRTKNSLVPFCNLSPAHFVLVSFSRLVAASLRRLILE